MNQWTLPSHGLLSQNVEAVCRRARVGCCLACSCPLPAWAQRWRACLVQVLHLDGRPIVLYPRCPAHWMNVVSRLPRDLLVKTCKTTKYPPLCGGYRLPLLRSITHGVTVWSLMNSKGAECHDHVPYCEVLELFSLTGLLNKASYRSSSDQWVLFCLRLQNSPDGYHYHSCS